MTRCGLKQFRDLAEHGEPGAHVSDVNVTGMSAVVVHAPAQPAFGHRPIRRIVRSCSSETRPCDSLVDLARAANLLVHEALHGPALGGLRHGTTGHASASTCSPVAHWRNDAGKVAERAGGGTPVIAL